MEIRFEQIPVKLTPEQATYYTKIHNKYCKKADIISVRDLHGEILIDIGYDFNENSVDQENTIDYENLNYDLKGGVNLLKQMCDRYTSFDNELRMSIMEAYPEEDYNDNDYFMSDQEFHRWANPSLLK